VTSLARPAFIVLTLGIVGKDGQNVGDVSETSKEEEEHAKPICRLASPVQDELRQSRSDICDSTEISKNLTGKAEVKIVLASDVGIAILFAVRGLLAQEPTYDTSSNDHQHNDGVPDNGLEDGRGSRCSIFGDMRNGRRQTRPV
jgi:hypothetical protein